MKYYGWVLYQRTVLLKPKHDYTACPQGVITSVTPGLICTTYLTTMAWTTGLINCESIGPNAPT